MSLWGDPRQRTATSLEFRVDYGDNVAWRRVLHHRIVRQRWITCVIRKPATTTPAGRGGRSKLTLDERAAALVGLQVIWRQVRSHGRGHYGIALSSSRMEVFHHFQRAPNFDLRMTCNQPARFRPPTTARPPTIRSEARRRRRAVWTWAIAMTGPVLRCLDAFGSRDGTERRR